MAGIRRPKFGAQPPHCPICVQTSTSVTEETVPRRLCDPDDREPGVYRSYEPCGHVVGTGVTEDDTPEFARAWLDRWVTEQPGPSAFDQAAERTRITEEFHVAGAAHAQIVLEDYDCPPQVWCDLCGTEVLSPVGDLAAAISAWVEHWRECPGDQPGWKAVMTPAEHRAKAEQLVEEAEGLPRRATMESTRAVLFAEAQVHATLALGADRESATTRRVEAVLDEWDTAIEPDGSTALAPVRAMSAELRARVFPSTGGA